MAKVQGVLRPRKDGCGCSLCTASEENVGKRRCVHTLNGVSMTVHRDGNTNFVNIDGTIDDNDVSLSIKATQKKVKEYITNLSNGLSKKDKENVLNALRSQQI